jgi:tetratricopeptide (TPR) repeat protein
VTRKPKTRSDLLAAVAGAISLAPLSAACATSPSAIELPQMSFEVVTGERGPRVESLDPETLYEEGNRAYQALDYILAAEKYGLVADRFATSRFGPASAYNAGMSLEKVDRHADAIARYRQLVALVPDSRDARDGLFRIAACQEALEDWPGMQETGAALLAPSQKGLTPLDRIAAHAIRGRGAEGRAQLALAERDYRAALDIYRDHLQLPAIAQSPFVSLAQFRIGEIYRQLFSSIQFRLPLDRMARDLEDKSNFFLMAQTAYLRAVRLKNPAWAVVAGYRLGLLYEVMYDDMMSAEIPPELTRDEVELYYAELRSQVRPLLDRAVDIYERNLRLGQRFGRHDEWVQRTEASLARLRDVMRADAGRAAELQIDSDR